MWEANFEESTIPAGSSLLMLFENLHGVADHLSHIRLTRRATYGPVSPEKTPPQTGSDPRNAAPSGIPHFKPKSG